MRYEYCPAFSQQCSYAYRRIIYGSETQAYNRIQYVAQGASRSGRFRHILQGRMDRKDKTDVVSRWSNILGADRLANANSSMLEGNKRDEARMYLRTSFDTYSDRHVRVGCLLLCAAAISLLCCAVLCCARGLATTYYGCTALLSAVKQLLYTGTAVPPATLAHKEAWVGITDRCKVDGPTFYVQTGDLQMPRTPCSMKTNGTQHACTHVHLLIRTRIGTYLVC